MNDQVLILLTQIKEEFGEDFFRCSNADRFRAIFNDLSMNKSEYKAIGRLLRDVIAEFDGFTVLCDAKHDKADKALVDKICSQKLSDRVETTRAVGYLAHIAGFKDYKPPSDVTASPKPQSPKPAQKTQTALPPSPAAPKTMRGYLCLEESEWAEAKAHFDAALDLEPEYAPAYVGLLCAELKVTSESEIVNQQVLISENPNFKRAVRFADDEQRTRLEQYNDIIKKRFDEQERAKAYAQLVNVKKLAESAKEKKSNDFRVLAKQFRDLGNYQNASVLASECEEEVRRLVREEELRKVRISPGKIIKFGSYEWRVLDVQNRQALLISKDVTHVYKPYNETYTDVTWESCTLQQWLNRDFLSEFSAQEQSQICLSTIPNEDNQWYGTKGGNQTTDRIFLLSLDEVDYYFGNSGDYRNKRRKKYVNDGNFQLDSDGFYLSNGNDKDRVAKYGKNASWWWLRSPGNGSHFAAYVSSDGYVNVLGNNVIIDFGGVRPALWLNL